MAKQQHNQKAAGKMQKAKAIKEGQVKKHNAPKFKQTPKGKVALINDNKNGNNQAKPFNKNQSSSKKQGGPKGAPSNKKGPQNKKNELLNVKKEEEDEDSDEDINEGIELPEDTSIVGEDDDDSSIDDKSSINILGESLADQSDSDDEDFEASDEEAEVENKGVKMFTGIKKSSNNGLNDTASSLSSSVDSSVADEDDDEEDDDEDDDDEDDDDGDDDKKPDLKALMDSMIEDDEDDEDFDGEEEEDDDDDDIDDSEEDEDEDDSQSDLNQSKASTFPSPTASKLPKLSPEEKAEVDKRTIFIGNVPRDIKESKMRSEFAKFGPIESLRVRGVVPESPKISLKIAARKKKFHPKVHSVCVFIIYKSEESAVKALTMNGKQLEGNYLRVDRANQQVERDPKKAVFLGNVPFDIEDNELWEIFSKCGKIEAVRTIRDRFTGACRGIAYVNFKTDDAATLALDLNGTTIRTREIRVARYTPGKKTKQTKDAQEKSKKRPLTGKSQTPSPKKLKGDDVETAKQNSVNAERRKDKKAKRSQGQQQRQPDKKEAFQGQAAEGKKKGKKPSKFEKKKKTMAGKLMAKPKKPVA